ncbi:MAG: FecR domain-containing protein, partial [Deltaproteobacteria bacterium]|nr:FecR domain-containing protein [Deltaproteobacteria bacterium]
MMVDKNKIPEDFTYLVEAALDGSIDADQLYRLDEEIVKNPTAREYYIQLMLIHAGLHQTMGAMNLLPPDQQSDATEVSSARLLAEAINKDERIRKEREAEELHQSALAKKKEVKQFSEEMFKKFQEEERRRQKKLAYKLYRARQRRLVLSVGTLAACLSLVFGLWIHHKLTSGPVVATLTRSEGAQWENNLLVAEPGTQLIASDYKLNKGFVEITFLDGAKVILEAPVNINLKNTNQMFLHSGKLAANIPPEAYGFRVDTPSASLIDLGTEFGLNVTPDNSSEFHVFKGKVSLKKNKDGSREISQIINSGQARRITPDSDEIQKIQLSRYAFNKSWKEVLYFIRTSSSVEQVREAPVSLERNRLESSSKLRLIHEQQNVTLDKEVNIISAIPGTHN